MEFRTELTIRVKHKTEITSKVCRGRNQLEDQGEWRSVSLRCCWKLSKIRSGFTRHLVSRDAYVLQTFGSSRVNVTINHWRKSTERCLVRS